MFEAHAGVRGAELPVDACLGAWWACAHAAPCAARPTRRQGLPRQDAQFQFGLVEPVAVPGRKHQPYALGQVPRP